MTPRKRRGNVIEDGSDPVDIYVGGRVRERRVMMGLTQDKLGDAIGLTFQQVQKYEKGSNRISASRLYQMSTVLDVPVSFFFDGYAPAVTYDPDHRLMTSRETLNLVKSYCRIPKRQTRIEVSKLVDMIADQFTLPG